MGNITLPKSLDSWLKWQLWFDVETNYGYYGKKQVFFVILRIKKKQMGLKGSLDRNNAQTDLAFENNA